MAYVPLFHPILTADIINQFNVLFAPHAETLGPCPHSTPIHHDHSVSLHTRRNLVATSELETVKLNRLKVSCEH